jgi:uncharacterized heparinase superfamily protein
MTSRLRPEGWADRVALTWRTVRFLRARQVAFRLLRPLRATSVEASMHGLRRACAAWVPADRMPPALQPDGRWCFHAHCRWVSAAAEWDDPGDPRLWRYHLHYFDDLRSAGDSSHSARLDPWIERWIAENPPGAGSGWEPYPVSRRIVSWLVWMLCDSRRANDARLGSLSSQAATLFRRMEHDLGANHLLANAKALIFAGAAMEGPQSRKWLEEGLRILDAQLAEQVLPDGGHYERSPMYHAIALEDLLDLVQLATLFPMEPLRTRLDSWRATAARMQAFLDAVSHPDGEIAFFNDACLGNAPSPSQLATYAARLGVPALTQERHEVALGESGYLRAARGPFLLLFDAAPIGPDDQPGHAHADTLSFELSVGRDRLVVNSGTSTYEPGVQRHFERSTAAHSTVELDEADSSEVWASFRVARRARPRRLETTRIGDVVQIVASHDGYRRLPGAPCHRRTFRLSASGFTIADEITGSRRHRAVGRIGLHPSISVEQHADGGWSLVTPAGHSLFLEGEDGTRVSREEGTFAERFGHVAPRAVLRWELEGSLPLQGRIRCTLR